MGFLTSLLSFEVDRDLRCCCMKAVECLGSKWALFDVLAEMTYVDQLCACLDIAGHIQLHRRSISPS